MRFDRTAVGGGVEAVCRLENGKVLLEWEFHLIQFAGQQEIKIPIPQKSEEERSLLWNESGYIRLNVTDRQDTLVLECVQNLCEEEPLQSILLQPELWKGIRNPCLYKIEAILMDGAGNVQDRVQRQLALRCLNCDDRSGKTEIFLNHERLELKAVRYALPDTGTDISIQRRMLEDLEWMRKLGVNCACMEYAHIEEDAEACREADKEIGRKCHTDAPSEWYSSNLPGSCADDYRNRAEKIQRLFIQLCDRFGILVFQQDKKTSGYLWAQGQKAGVWMPSEEEIPSFRGGKDSLFPADRRCPAPLFYKYQAKWSEAPFVHIVPESVRRMESGNYTALCYSNCDRVALYSDGILFEFKSGEGEFLFREIPVRTPSIMLTAEGEGCSHSLSLHKSFTK